MSSTSELAVSFGDVRDAAGRIEGFTRRTPILTSSAVNDHCASQVFFKCENLQNTGSFKFRGAFNALARLNEAERQRGATINTLVRQHGLDAAFADTLIADGVSLDDARSAILDKLAEKKRQLRGHYAHTATLRRVDLSDEPSPDRLFGTGVHAPLEEK